MDLQSLLQELQNYQETISVPIQEVLLSIDNKIYQIDDIIFKEILAHSKKDIGIPTKTVLVIKG